jgi:uncharacterized protein YjaZ
MGKVSISIYTFFKYSEHLGRKDFSESVLKDIRKGRNGYAGWKYKSWLKTSLDFINKRNTTNIKYPKIKNIDSECKKIINRELRKVKKFVNQDLFIYVFPINDDFIIRKMSGVSGMTINKDTIYLEIYPAKTWKKELANTTIHEITHLITGYHFNKPCLVGEALIHEGIAENFRESLLGGKEPFVEALSKEKAMKIFKEIKSLLNKRDTENIHNKIFFGTGKYPNWTGYSIGYYLVKRYLNKKFKSKNIDWNKLLREYPNQMLLEL